VRDGGERGWLGAGRAEGSAGFDGGSGGALVLGIGNTLARDDGVGCRVVRALADAGPASGLPGDAEVVDGGTIGLGLLPLIEPDRALVLVDAAELGEPPGTVRVLDAEMLRGLLGGRLSVHQVGVADLLAAANLAGVLPRQVALVAIQPAAIGVGMDLSGPVEATLPVAMEAVRETVRRFIDEARAPPKG
jgi:hydrogenase maturation protease